MSCVLKVESTGFADGLGVQDERRGILDATKDLGLSTQGLKGDWCLLRCQTVANQRPQSSDHGILSLYPSFLFIFFSVEKLRFGKCK